MPIYEFYCRSCSQQVEIFRRSVTATGPSVCPACGGADLSRLISRFAVHRSPGTFGSPDEERYIEGLEEGDPRAMAAWARRMGPEAGEDMEPGLDEMVSRMGAGEMPADEFDDDLGDLAG